MIILKNKSPSILVVGDLMIDHYLWGSSNRISPEAPVPIVSVENESKILGGAGNVLNNLKALGAKVDVMSVLGGCEISHELKLLLDEIGINTQYLVIDKNRISSKKSRLIAEQQQVVRFDQECTDEISKSAQKLLLNNFRKIIFNYDCLLLSDYGKGVLTTSLTKDIIKIANKHSIKVLVDPQGFDYSKYRGSYLLTPNLKEAEEATQIEINDDISLKKALTHMKSEYELDISLITLSENGIAIYDDKLRKHPTVAREVYDVTGAGDAILASLGFAICCKLSIDEAVKFSNLAAGVVVGKIGSATASINEIIQYESSLNKSTSNEHIKNITEIISLIKELKKNGKKIVFTNGCFDLLHVGHIKYLEEAKRLGDVLVVGLNSDKSVNLIKGDGRPINSQNNRAYLLAALEVVDYVVIFEEETPYKLINKIKPHTLVKGGDYKGKKVVGQDIADELKIVNFFKGKSTTQTIDTIRENNNSKNEP